MDKPCPQCGFQGDANRLDELSHVQWLLIQMEKWEKFEIDTAPVSKLKEIYASHLMDTQVALGLRLPPLTPKEAVNARVELGHLETLFKKVDEWRTAGFFKPEMESLDPVKTQRAHADELRQRLEEYPGLELNPTAQDRLKTMSFLLDTVDLLDSREWFNKKDLEKVVAPIMAMMADAFSDNEHE